MTAEKLTTQKAILAAGKEEFLKYGFEKASLRTIAGKAGVTTGAIYGYYADKAALFDALVAAPAEKFYNAYREATFGFDSLAFEEQVEQVGDMPLKDLDKWVGLIYDDIDAFKLIFSCSGGTKWAQYVDSLIEIEENASRCFIAQLHKDGRRTRDISDEAIHALTGSFFLAITEMVIHDMRRSEAKKYLVLVAEFFTAGWLKILNLE